jgi:hypothetical protein
MHASYNHHPDATELACPRFAAGESYSRLKPNRDSHSSDTMAGTFQTKPNILSPVAHSAGRSQLTGNQKFDLVGLVKSLKLRRAAFGVGVVDKLFSPEAYRLQAHQQQLLDSPLFGSEENCSFSTLQVNISPLERTDLSSLGYGGRSHVDGHDDPMSLTLLICIS